MRTKKSWKVAIILAILISLCVFFSPIYSEDTYEQELYSPIQPPDESSILLSVNFMKNIGSFKSDQITIRFPFMTNGAAKELDLLKEMGYSSVEISVGRDFSEIFPNPDASPTLPESYNFKPLDDRIKKAIENGATIVFTIELPSPPLDYSLYSTQIEYTLKHLLQGWAGGFRLTERELKLLLLDCNPDKDSWKNHEEDYLRVYSLFAITIKRINPKLSVGGLGFSTVFNNEKSYNFEEISPLFTTVLEHMKSNKIPIDVLFMQHRGMIPYGYFLKTRSIEQNLLKDYGSLSPLYGKPRIACRAEVIPSGESSLFQSSVFVSAITCLIKGGAHYILLPFPTREKNTLCSTLKSINIFQDCPIQIETIGLDRMCFILMAAKSCDGKKVYFVVSGNNPSLYLLSALANSEKVYIEEEYRKYVETFSLDKKFSPLYNRYHLHIENLPWEGKKVLYRRYALGRSHTMECVEEKTLSGMKELYFNKLVSHPAVQVIFLEELKE